MVLDNTDIIDNDQQKFYIDLDYFIFDASGIHVIITSRSSTVKKMTTLNAVEITNMKSSKTIELFQKYAKIKERGQNIATEMTQIVNKLGYLTLAITLTNLYVSVTDRLSFDIKQYFFEYRQRRKELLRRRTKRYIYQYRESVLNT